MQKILIVINNLMVGGAERLVVDQANYLEKLGHEVHVLTLLPRNKTGFYNNLHLTRGKLMALPVKPASLKGIFILSKIIKQGGYDAIISHLFFANTLTRLAKILAFSRIKMLVYEHNVYAKDKSFKHFLIDWILSIVTYRVIAVSNLVKDFLVSKKIPKEKIVVIENGISSDFVHEVTPAKTMRQQLGFSEKDFLVVSSGNLNPQKGYETLVASAVDVVQEYPNTHFLICGTDTNKYASALKKEVVNNGLESNFHFLGSRLDATSIVHCSDIFVMTSFWEGLSISLLEALLLGKTIIVSNIPSLEALIKDHHNGLVFEVGRATSLARLIMDVIGNPSQYKNLGENAKITGNHYSIDFNVKELLAVLTATHDRKN